MGTVIVSTCQILFIFLWSRQIKQNFNTGPRLLGVKNLSKKVMSSVHDYLLRKKKLPIVGSFRQFR